ncbi:hypothetical protein AVEN_77075-1 [Araneus ventricosus]|uniref:Uncharacterized protein n=1 Tax=Araneus ventricosus TaxID=182803 RepID=A0A4Y1ZTW5_ARAVE|nr:hypothetical protein AVEN_77075-1 [Araneus ventricosus]
MMTTVLEFSASQQISKNVSLGECSRLYGFNLKPDIQERFAPHHSERFAPYRSNFQPIHLGGSFMEAPCKRHNRPLQSPRTEVPNLWYTYPMGVRETEGGIGGNKETCGIQKATEFCFESFDS